MNVFKALKRRSPRITLFGFEPTVVNTPSPEPEPESEPEIESKPVELRNPFDLIGNLEELLKNLNAKSPRHVRHKLFHK